MMMDILAWYVGLASNADVVLDALVEGGIDWVIGGGAINRSGRLSAISSAIAVVALNMNEMPRATYIKRLEAFFI